MTTMDSDSESQDSDDGRRFRFEATRKDATPVSHNRKRVSLHSDRTGQRSRSQGRSDRDRRDNERLSNRDRDSRSGHNSRQTCRDRNLKDRRDRHSSHNYLKDSKDAHDSKHLKHRNGSSTQRERDDREVRDLKDARESKGTRDSKETRDSRESHSKSCRSHEKDPKNSKESRSSRDRNRKRSRDRSRSCRSSSDKHKIRNQEKHKSHSRDSHTRDRVPEKIEDAKTPLIAHTENNLKVDSLSTQDRCTEFNISDFEIVSDTENSSDAFGNSPSDKPKVKKRLSKQQSQRLSDGDSERKSHRREDLRKVNPRNGNHSSASSNSNPSALSDFLLGSASPTTSAKKKLKGDEEEEASRMEVDVETLQDFSVREKRSNSNESVEPFSYGPVLPPQLVRGSSPDLNPVYEKEESEVVVKKEIMQNNSVENKEKIERENLKNEKMIGPLLPPSSFKSSDLDRLEDDPFPSAKEVNLDRDDHAVKAESEEESSSGTLRKESLKGSSQPRIIGPSLPDHLLPQKEESDEDTFGPALPPHLMKKEKSEDRAFALTEPTLPNKLMSDDVGSVDKSESDDEDIIGPLPPDHPAARNSIVHQSLEFRARRIQSEFMSQKLPKAKKREEWMTELPAVQSATLGLGPRKFKARPGPDLSDRSSWTDTPADRARKEQEMAEERLAALVTEKAMVQEISTSKEDVSEKSKKRQKSLLEMHQKKLKKQKKKEENEAKEKGKPTRRPFDRDVDLQANRFDEAQKKHVFMKAQLLDDRFTRGSI